VAILVTAAAANLGIIPAGSTAQAPVPVYDVIFAHVAPISIFWLLLQVHLKSVLKAGPVMLGLFFIGSVGTMVGVLLAVALVDASSSIGPLYKAVAGMFAGTYIGGSVNFNAIALEYDVVRNGVLYGGAIVVDNIITAIWMAATIGLPKLLAPVWRASRVATNTVTTSEPMLGIAEDTESVHPVDLAMVFALGLAAHWISLTVSAMLAARGISMPAILILTVLALVLAQVPAVARLKGTRVVGLLAVYLFLAVIGAFADVRQLSRLGGLGITLLIFAGVTVLVHGVITFGAAWILRLDRDAAAVASQANVGGSTSALALARSLGREDLIVPGILAGSVGNAIGTFAGFMIAVWLT
jgi:uncharacterized membrane protein